MRGTANQFGLSFLCEEDYMYNKIVRPSLKTKKWEKFRDKILRKYNYLCQESLRYGISEPAEMVHHIFPVSEYPEL